MVDPVEFFGTKAGRVWEALSSGEKTINQICEITGLTRREVAMGLGWLAREGKIGVRKPGRHHLFRLL